MHRYIANGRQYVLKIGRDILEIRRRRLREGIYPYLDFTNLIHGLVLQNKARPFTF
jgi:hypothetical protein